MFSLYKYLSVFSTPRFIEWEFLSDCTFPDHCLLVPLQQFCKITDITVIVFKMTMFARNCNWGSFNLQPITGTVNFFMDWGLQSGVMDWSIGVDFGMEQKTKLMSVVLFPAF